MMIRTYLLALLCSVQALFCGQKVILFNDTSAWYHWGCTGTSTALKEGITSLGFELEAISIQQTYTMKEVPPFESFDDPGKFTIFCQLNKEICAALKGSDIVVITGEGTIHDLRDGPRALLYIAYCSKKFLAKRCEIVNHSAYPKDDPQFVSFFLQNFPVEKSLLQAECAFAESIYQKVYKTVDFVAIREPLSLKKMEELGLHPCLSFDCLPLFIRDHYLNCKHKIKNKGEKKLVLAGSVAFTEEGSTAICRYLEGMVNLGFEIQVLIGAADYPAKDDLAFVDFLKKECRVPFHLINARSIDEWLDTISCGTLLVSGRFHHSIAAFCLNTPFIALNSNTQKVHSICSQLDVLEPLHFSDPNLLERLKQRTDEILANPIVDHGRKVVELCSLAERNLDGLRSVMKNN